MLFVASTMLLFLMSFLLTFDSITTFSSLGYLSLFFQSLKIPFAVDLLYLSLYISIAALFSVHLFAISKGSGSAVISAVAFLILFASLLCISFKTGLIATIISFGIYSLLANQTRVWLLFGFSLMGMISLVVFSPQVNQRFSQSLIVKEKASFDLDSLLVRYSLEKCGVELLPKAGLFGFGIGDGKTELMGCYDSIDSDLSKIKYNIHNQYLSIILNVGFIGLLIFLACLFIYAIATVNQKNFLSVAIIILFSSWMLSENILERQGGVMYFSLIATFLFLSSLPAMREKKIILSHEKVFDALKV